MPRLKVKEVAEQQGKSISEISFDARIPLGTVRRYYYGTSEGRAAGRPLTEVDLVKLGAIAKALGVRVSDLIEDDRLARLIAAEESGNDQSGCNEDWSSAN